MEMYGNVSRFVLALFLVLGFGLSPTAWKCMEMYGNEWKCMEMYGNVWKCMEMYGNVWKCMETITVTIKIGMMFLKTPSSTEVPPSTEVSPSLKGVPHSRMFFKNAPSTE